LGLRFLRRFALPAPPAPHVPRETPPRPPKPPKPPPPAKRAGPPSPIVIRLGKAWGLMMRSGRMPVLGGGRGVCLFFGGSGSGLGVGFQVE
jgi:hypothetical protein